MNQYAAQPIYKGGARGAYVSDLLDIQDADEAVRHNLTDKTSSIFIRNKVGDWVYCHDEPYSYSQPKLVDDVAEPLPDWVSKRSKGKYMVLGTQLLTRDGRRLGNAVITGIEFVDGAGVVATCVTDAGNTFRMTKRELKSAFHKPIFILKLPLERTRRPK